MKEKIIELFMHDDCPVFLVVGGTPKDLADFLVANGVTITPAVPGPKMGHDMAETPQLTSAEKQAIFRLGQMDMRDSMAEMLRDLADGTYGVVCATLLDAAERVRKMEIP